MNKFKSVFGPLVKHLPKYKAPGTPGLVLTKPLNPEAVISTEDQKTYRMGVGMLLYLVKYTRPDLANATRELSKHMKEASPSAYKEFLRTIKYVCDTNEYGLKLAPTDFLKYSVKGELDWNLHVYTDSDWAGDKDNRKSVTGYILFV